MTKTEYKKMRSRARFDRTIRAWLDAEATQARLEECAANEDFFRRCEAFEHAGTFSDAAPTAALTTEVIERFAQEMKSLSFGAPYSAGVVVHPRYLAMLRRHLSPVTGVLALASPAAGALPLYESNDMPAEAMATLMSDGTVQVTSIGRELTCAEYAQAVQVARVVTRSGTGS